MCSLSKTPCRAALGPIELDAAHHPWGSYLGTVTALSTLFVDAKKARDEVQAYLFTDTRHVSGDTTLLAAVRSFCHAQMLPLPEYAFPVKDLLRQIGYMEIQVS